jgi:hypothetical protein
VQETPCFSGVTRNRVSGIWARSVQRDAGRVGFDAPVLSEISSEFLSEFPSELRDPATAQVPVALIRSTLGIGDRSGREFTAVALSARTVCEYRRNVRLTSVVTAGRHERLTTRRKRHGVSEGVKGINREPDC